MLFRAQRVLLLLLLLAGPSVAAEAAGQFTLLLVRSSSSEEYRLACAGFEEAIRESGRPVTVKETVLPARDGQDPGAASFWRLAEASRPALIVMAGTLASRSALQHLKDTPAAFTMVLDDPSLNVSPGAGRAVFGITLSIPLAVQLEEIRNTLPTARRAGYLFPLNSQVNTDSIISLGDKAGLRLIAAPVKGKEDVAAALESILDGIDLLWLPPDPLIYRQDVIRYLLESCYSRNVPVFAFSKQLALAGAPLALGSDYRDVGRQTAEKALEYLFPEENSPLPAGAGTSRKIQLFVNQSVAESLGLHIPRRVLSRAVIVGNGAGSR